MSQEMIDEPCSAISISRRPYCACFIRRTAKSLKPDEFFYRKKKIEMTNLLVQTIETDMVHLSNIRSGTIFSIAIGIAGSC